MNNYFLFLFKLILLDAILLFLFYSAKLLSFNNSDNPFILWYEKKLFTKFIHNKTLRDFTNKKTANTIILKIFYHTFIFFSQFYTLTSPQINICSRSYTIWNVFCCTETLVPYIVHMHSNTSYIVVHFA